MFERKENLEFFHATDKANETKRGREIVFYKKNAFVIYDKSRLPSLPKLLLLFYVQGKPLRSCRDGQLTLPHFFCAGLDLLSG